MSLPLLLSSLIGLSGLAAEPQTTAGPVGYTLVRVPGGTYMRGCTPGQLEYCHKSEKPAHSVTIGHDLWVGQTEVTIGHYVAVMGSSPHQFQICDDHCPVESVSWLDAIRFANALSSKEGLESCYAIDGTTVTWPRGTACTGYRLPTEAEWEYAARGGQDLAYGHTTNVDEAGWTVSNAKGHPQPVASLAANGFGLHDMVGNVWEWTWDWKGKYKRKAMTDPMGPDAPKKGEERRVLRGGSWAMFTTVATVSTRNAHAPDRADPNTGFRLVRTATDQ
jgi:formylglycine-generating enzyme required for sulfatase activity